MKLTNCQNMAAFTIFITTILCAEVQQSTIQFIQVKKATNKNILPFNRDFFTEMQRLFNIEVFVETGTYLGDTSEIAATVFNEVRTVELSPELYELARKRFAQNSKIFLYQGDSGYELLRILSEVKSNENIMILLDSHWSGGNTACGIDVPILREIDSIKKSGIKNSVILIDDIRCFQKQTIPNTYPFEYPDLPLVIQRIKEINTQYTCWIYGDLLLAFVNPTIKVPTIVQAMTISRLNQGDGQTLSRAETIIGGCSDEHFYHLSQLSSLLDVSTGPVHMHYYDFWYAIALNNRGQKNEAHALMSHAANLGLSRARHYLELWK